VAYQRDTEALKEALKRHSLDGYTVAVPIFGSGRILQQWRIGTGDVYFVVEADSPVPFSKFADSLRVDDVPMDLKGWQEQIRAGGSLSIPVMRPELRERLEAGGKVSHRERLLWELIDSESIDERQNVVRYSFGLGQTELHDPRRGMLVEFHDRESKYANWPGKIVGIEKKDVEIVLLELFSPIPFLDSPYAVDEEEIRKGFYSGSTAALGYGTVEAWEETGRDLPKGRWMNPSWGAQEERFYVLDELIPLSEVEAVCKGGKTKYPERLCVLQSAWMYVLPIRKDGGTFRPLPEGLEADEVMAEYEF
jgi:hypothetical protein